jgi:hypothetical protein
MARRGQVVWGGTCSNPYFLASRSRASGERCDRVRRSRAADDETASSGLLRLASQGNLRTTTMRAFSAEEARRVVEKTK